MVILPQNKAILPNQICGKVLNSSDFGQALAVSQDLPEGLPGHVTQPNNVNSTQHRSGNRRRSKVNQSALSGSNKISGAGH